MGFALLDGGDDVGAAVEADDRDLVEQVGGLEGRDGTEGHRVVAGDHAVDVAVALQDRLHLGERLLLVPVRALAGDLLERGDPADHVGVALGAHAGVGVGLLADEFDVLALAAERLDELLRAELGALGVVGDDLRGGDAGRVDLAIDQEYGMPASSALRTGPIEASAPALSRMIAFALREIAASMSSLCLFGSSSCEATDVS